MKNNTSNDDQTEDIEPCTQMVDERAQSLIQLNISKGEKRTNSITSLQKMVRYVEYFLQLI